MTTEETATPAVSAEPGLLGSGSAVVDNLPHNEYLAMPALSVSGMKLLLPPSCPALFDYWRQHRRPGKRAFDKGHAVHNLVLGDGPEMVVIDADDWRTKTAREERDAAYEAGQVPILTAEYAEAQAMAAAVRTNRLADSLLSHGRPEVTLTWTDPATGVKLRGRIDWLRDKTRGRLYAVDLKTASSADPKSFARAAANFGYHQQNANYVDGIKACGLSDDPGFLFVVVETAPPYLVSVIELDPDAVTLGRDLNGKATRLFKACTESGHWPGYASDIAQVALPTWYTRQMENEMSEEDAA